MKQPLKQLVRMRTDVGTLSQLLTESSSHCALRYSHDDHSIASFDNIFNMLNHAFPTLFLFILVLPWSL